MQELQPTNTLFQGDERRPFATQPNYATNPRKIEARRVMVEAYRQITGNLSIPQDKTYWTLCNWQSNVEGAEIVQLEKMGFLSKRQFVGVDRDEKGEGIIEFNRQHHPEATWFHGEWLTVIHENYSEFNPALVYFDSTQAVMTPANQVCLAKTMDMCPPGTVVAANMMLSDGRSSRKFDAEPLMQQLTNRLLFPSEWSYTRDFYFYRGSHTDMGTFFFVRK